MVHVYVSCEDWRSYVYLRTKLNDQVRERDIYPSCYLKKNSFIINMTHIYKKYKKQIWSSTNYQNTHVAITYVKD